MALPRTRTRVRDGSFGAIDSFPEISWAPTSAAPPRLRRLGVALSGSDALSLIGALLVSRWLGRSILPPSGRGYALTMAGSLVVWMSVFLAFGLHPVDRLVHRLSTLDEVRRTVAAASLGVVLITVGFGWSQGSVSRLSIGLTWLLVVAFELGSRQAWRWYRARLMSDGRLAYRTLIVGANEEALNLAETMGIPGSGFSPIGFVAASVPANGPYALPLVGWVDGLDQAIRDHAADCVLVVPTALRTEEITTVMQVARRAGVEVQTSLNMPETLASRVSVQKIGPTMVFSTARVRFTPTQAMAKRSFDFVIASLMLLLSLPAWILIALAIRLNSRGPVLFRQARVTKGGRVFMMHKFRTMKVDAVRMLEEHSIDATQPFFKMNGDLRLTSVGRLLRTLSLDELPQLLNVLKGDMSLVGPRPLPAEQVAANSEMLARRHEVLAGMTGWWQINGRRNVDPEEAVRLDQFYIENWSLSLDLYILSKTLGVVLTRRGAF
jgi:exopolysaccharide biosynthesis polyprenyl glycosylphosphotransferase